MLGSTWWHVCKIRQLCADPNPNDVTVIPDAADTLAEPEREPVSTITTPVTAPVAPPDTNTSNLPVTEKGLAEAEVFSTVFKPISLFFPIGQSDYIKTDATKAFFTEAATYLKANPDKKLRLTGYTDNTGPEESNLNLSRQRANRVKSRLEKEGIATSQIVVDAKGEAEPKYSNETLQGRRANRRVTAVVQ